MTDMQIAIRHYSRAIKIDPDYAEARRHLNYVQRKINSPQN
ncbi:MAG: tetratricopeptide repeat protein [Deltaproteobacteria bacterium]|nr:tetratricopeptide repeat protein [Deltaproteobacteria bacterium]